MDIAPSQGVRIFGRPFISRELLGIQFRPGSIAKVQSGSRFLVPMWEKPFRAIVGAVDDPRMKGR